MNIRPYLKQTRVFLSNNTPRILTGVAIGGVLSTVYLAVDSTPKAIKAIDAIKVEEPTVTDKIKATWKFYIPAALSCAGTIGCIIGAQTVNNRRQAALAGLYSISEKTLLEYKEELLTALGDEGAAEVRKNVSQRTANPDYSFAPKPDGTEPQTQVIVVDDSEQLCHDAWSGRYFKSSRNAIEKARNDANSLILIDGYITVNEFYDHLGLDYIDAGNIVGWDTDNLIDFSIDAVIGPDMKPCLSIQHRVAPKPFGKYGEGLQ